MRKVYLFIFCCCLAAIAKAQPVVAVSPTGAGGFEIGSPATFVTNGWIDISPAGAVSQWKVGSAAVPFAGANSAFISGDGSTYGYATTGNYTCHFFRGEFIPATARNITLNFMWKATADTATNRLIVYVANDVSTTMPVANLPTSPGTSFASWVKVWQQDKMTGTYDNAVVSIPDTFVNRSVRFIFTWQNGTTGGGTPASVDNISINYCVWPAPVTGQLRQCVGQAVPLVNPVLGGTWSSSNTSVATIVPGTGLMTGMAPGTTVISYTNACGTMTAVDTVIPALTPIVGNDSVCLGTQSGLANISFGGTWSSTYPTIASVLPGSGLVTGLNAGITTITYTMLPGCYVTQNVTVTPTPPAITGTPEVCAGQTITLHNSITGGTWYSANPSGATAGSTTGVISGVDPSGDTATITYTAPYGCKNSVVVTIKPQPSVIFGEMTKCKGQTDTLYNTTPGGTWSSSSPSVAIVGASTGVITAVNTGTANILYTLTTTGCFRSQTVTVLPGPIPVVTYDNWTQTFSTDTSYLSYQWYNSIIGAIPGATTFKTAAADSACYWVVVTDGSTCAGKSEISCFNPKTVAVPGIDAASVKIHPNPATETVFIDAPVNVTAVITGIDGRLEIEKAKASRIDISNLRNGIYFISLYDDTGRKLKVEKLIKL